MAERLLVLGLLDEGRVGKDGGKLLEEIAETTLERCRRNDKGLGALDLSNTHLSTFFLSELSSTLQHNTKLTEIHLNRCRIGDEGARVLAQGLGLSVRILAALSLEENEIGCKGASYLAKMMDLRGTKRGRSPAAGSRPLFFAPGPGLRYLSLKGNAVSSVGARAIAEVLARSDDSLETLVLEANQIGDWGSGWFALAVRYNDALRCLNLCRNPIGNRGIEELRTACRKRAAFVVVPDSDEGRLETQMVEETQLKVYASEALASSAVEKPQRTPCMDSDVVSQLELVPESKDTSLRLLLRAHRRGLRRRKTSEQETTASSGDFASALSPSPLGSSSFIGSSPLGSSPLGTSASPLGSSPIYSSLAAGDLLEVKAGLSSGRPQTAHGRWPRGDVERRPRWRRNDIIPARPSRPLVSEAGRGCGAAAARSLRRAWSAPGSRRGMLLGPSAAMSMCA
mmetsp:Transcript_12712/g.28098  ORF Transcript_12712/g.28098 Transcript_12712/m.28098 type:complete len:454 (-) Transcript_12712:162-1523(-)